MTEQQHHWDGSRWLIWDGDHWVENPEQLPPPPAQAPSAIEADPQPAVDETPQPQGKHYPDLRIVAGVIVAIIAVIVIANLVNDNDGKAGSRTVGGMHEVTYQVEGSAKTVDITYSTSNGGTAQQSDIDVPMTRKSDGLPGIVFQMPSGAFMYISAQNQDESGSVTCTIRVDGVQYVTNTSDGGFVIASCDGRVP